MAYVRLANELQQAHLADSEHKIVIAAPFWTNDDGPIRMKAPSATSVEKFLAEIDPAAKPLQERIRRIVIAATRWPTLLIKAMEHKQKEKTTKTKKTSSARSNAKHKAKRRVETAVQRRVRCLKRTIKDQQRAARRAAAAAAAAAES